MKYIHIFFLLVTAFLFFSCQSEKPTPSFPERENMIRIPSGRLNMGGDNEQADRNEFPKHEVQISAFWMDKTEVTNQQFMTFVKATNYQTIAERPINWEAMKKEQSQDLLHTN